MEWLALLADIFEVCIVPLLGVLTAYLVKYIQTKSKALTDQVDNDTADKYILMLADTITACVIATNQTYVENLKKDNLFDADAQKHAFEMTYQAVMNVLSEDAKKYLTNVYGDLTTFITQRIEAEVALQK